MRSVWLLPYQQPVLRRSNRVNVTERCILEPGILFDDEVKPVPFEQSHNAAEELLKINFQDDLLDLLPVTLLDPIENLQLALFDVDLEKIDALDLLLVHHARQAPQSSRKRLGRKALVEDVVRIVDKLGHSSHARLLLIHHEGFDDFFFGRRIGVKPRQQGKTGEIGQRGGLRFVGQSEVEQFGVGSIQRSVGAQQVEDDWTRLKRVDLRAPADLIYEQGE